MSHTPIINLKSPYVGLSRNILQLDMVFDGETPEYFNDFATHSYMGLEAITYLDVISHTPEFIEINSMPRILKKDCEKISFNVFERMIIAGFDSVKRREDSELFKIINDTMNRDNGISVAGLLQPDNLILGITLLEQKNILADKILVSPHRYKDIRLWTCDKIPELNLSSKEELKKRAYGGNYMGCDIFVSPMLPKNAIYIIAEAEIMGYLSIKYDICAMDVNKEFELGVDITETVGFCVTNPDSIVRVQVH